MVGGHGLEVSPPSSGTGPPLIEKRSYGQMVIAPRWPKMRTSFLALLITKTHGAGRGGPLLNLTPFL